MAASRNRAEPPARSATPWSPGCARARVAGSARRPRQVPTSRGIGDQAFARMVAPVVEHGHDDAPRRPRSHDDPVVRLVHRHARARLLARPSGRRPWLTYPAGMGTCRGRRADPATRAPGATGEPRCRGPSRRLRPISTCRHERAGRSSRICAGRLVIDASAEAGGAAIGPRSHPRSGPADC